MLVSKISCALFVVFSVHRPFNFLFTKEYLKHLISYVGLSSTLAYIIEIILLIMSQQNNYLGFVNTSSDLLRPFQWFSNLWDCLNVYLAADLTTMTKNFTIIKPRGQFNLLRFGGKYCKAFSFHNGWKFHYILTSIVSRSDLCPQQHLKKKNLDWLRLMCSCVALR